MKEPRGETSAIGTLVTFILLMAALGVLWVYSGGPERGSYEQGPFLSMPLVPTVPLPTGVETPAGQPQQTDPDRTLRDYFYNFGTGYTGTEEKSPYADFVSLEFGDPANTNPKYEYVTIRITSNTKTATTISGWSLTGTSGIVGKIGSAAHLPSLGQVNAESPVSVPPNSVLYVSTGRSPSGVSFRTNQCTGYFEQFQDYYPALRGECPRPTDEMLRYPDGIAGNRTCIEFIERLYQCQLYTTAIPGNIGSSCQNFVLNVLSYNGCMNAHRNDPGFYKNEWRMFLNRDQELWQSKYERIRLLDENGKLIDVLSY